MTEHITDEDFENTSIQMNMETYNRLLVEYHKARKAGEDSFIFDGKPVMLKFAYYLLEYMSMQLLNEIGAPPSVVNKAALLTEAVTNGGICLMRATHKKTGQQRYLAGIRKEQDGVQVVIPLAVIEEDDLVDLYDPPGDMEVGG